jgi:16S rRNA processing protein RimM
VGPPFGLKGFVKVKPFSGETAHLSGLGRVTLRQGENEETRKVEELVFQSSALLLRFSGIQSPEAATALKGAEVIVDSEYAAPLKEGEYYVEDLKGLEVVTATGQSLGCITDVVEGGGGDLLEIMLAGGETRFAPFRNEFFGDVNLEENKITLLESWILE